MRPPDRDYSHRGVVDKLGVKLGHVAAFDEEAWPIDGELRAQILERASFVIRRKDRPPAPR